MLRSCRFSVAATLVVFVKLREFSGLSAHSPYFIEPIRAIRLVHRIVLMRLGGATTGPDRLVRLASLRIQAHDYWPVVYASSAGALRGDEAKRGSSARRREPDFFLAPVVSAYEQGEVPI